MQLVTWCGGNVCKFTLLVFKSNVAIYLDSLCWEHNEWRLALGLVNLTKAHLANTFDLAAPLEPSQIRYSHERLGMLPGTAGRSVQGFLDRWRSWCSVVWSTVGTLQRNSVTCSGTTIVLNIQSFPHLALVTVRCTVLVDLKYFKSFLISLWKWHANAKIPDFFSI